MWKWIGLIAVSVSLAASASAQRAIAAGAGPTAGMVGGELTWRTGRLGVSVGGGLAGVGARGLVYIAPEAAIAETRVERYVSLGYLATPWRFGNVDATGAAIAEGGVQLWPQRRRRLFADLAAGLAAPHGGTWGGNTLGLTVRLQLGVVL